MNVVLSDLKKKAPVTESLLYLLWNIQEHILTLEIQHGL